MNAYLNPLDMAVAAIAKHMPSFDVPHERSWELTKLRQMHRMASESLSAAKFAEYAATQAMHHAAKLERELKNRVENMEIELGIEREENE